MGFKDYLNVYEFSCTLPGTKQEVKYKPLTTGQIKKLLVNENEENPIVIENIFDELISSSVVNEDFNIDDIYVQDRSYLLIEIRKNSKGDQMSFQFKCPKCESQNLNYFDFNSLDIKQKENEEYGCVEISDDVKIYIDFITRGEQKESYNLIETGSLEKIRNDMSINSLAATIKKIESPDGIEEIDIKDKLWIVDSLTIDNLEKMKKWFDENNFGIDMEINMTCNNCGHSEKRSDIEFDSNFF